MTNYEICNMTTPANTLKEIHRLRRYIKELQTKLGDIPRKLQSRKGDIAYHEEKLKIGQDELKKLKVKTHDDDVSLKIIAEQIAKYERQLNTIMSKKEFDALKSEIAHGRAKADALEDVILAQLAEIDERTANIPRLEKALKDAREELTRFEKESQEQTGSLTGELQRVQKELADAEANLPYGELQAQYERLIRLMGEDSFAAVSKGTCQACYTNVTAQEANQLLQGQFMLCKACGRILYAAD
jgi:predicted  nucleic acid-binding Zn-ribbon protein